MIARPPVRMTRICGSDVKLVVVTPSREHHAPVGETGPARRGPQRCDHRQSLDKNECRWTRGLVKGDRNPWRLLTSQHNNHNINNHNHNDEVYTAACEIGMIGTSSLQCQATAVMILAMLVSQRRVQIVLAWGSLPIGLLAGSTEVLRSPKPPAQMLAREWNTTASEFAKCAQ